MTRFRNDKHIRKIPLNHNVGKSGTCQLFETDYSVGQTEQKSSKFQSKTRSSHFGCSVRLTYFRTRVTL